MLLDIAFCDRNRMVILVVVPVRLIPAATCPVGAGKTIQLTACPYFVTPSQPTLR